MRNISISAPFSPFGGRGAFWGAFLLLILFSLHTANAEKYILDLDKSIEIAKEKSYSMKNLQKDFESAEYSLKAATSRLKTHINLNMTLPDYSETIRTFEDSTGITFYPIKQLRNNIGLEINQPLITDGNLFIQTGLSNYDDYFSNNRSTQLNTRFGFRQPIDALYGYNAIRNTLKQAKLAYERSSKQLQREELNLVYEVSSSFYNLLSVQKSVEIAELNLERQTEAYNIAKNKYEAGLIREVDALQMEVDLAEAQNSYDMVLVNQRSSDNAFKHLLGLELDDEVELSSSLEYEIVLVDPEKAVELALAHRLEIREQEIQIELGKMNVKQQKVQGMIRGNINAYYEKIGVNQTDIKSPIMGSIGNAYQNFIDRPQNYGVGFTISVPILDWGENRAQVRAAETRLEQNIMRKEETERNIEREVRNLVNDLNSSLKRLQLLEKNINVAEKSFEITRQRYSDGDIDSQALALERNRLNNAYNSHLSAYINYQLKLADIMRKTFYDFKNNKEI